MKRILPVIAVLASCCLFTTGCHQSAKDYSKQYFADLSSISIGDKYGQIQVSHCWRELQEKDYLFDVPSADSIAAWKALCESRFACESADCDYLKKSFRSLNHYVSFYDLVELWYHEDSLKPNDELTLWRLTQFCPLEETPTLEEERFRILGNTICDLYDIEPDSQWDLNFWSGVKAHLWEFYCRVLDNATISRANGELEEALLNEREAWNRYHEALNNAFCILEGNAEGLNGSAWPMSVTGILEEDADFRIAATKEYYFVVADGWRKPIEELERHAIFSVERVLDEYHSFMNTLPTDEYYFPVEDRKEALAMEMHAWEDWMKSREHVSSLLSGNERYIFNNSTNNLRRRKLIMLKNRYEAYGITSYEVMESQIPYEIDDAALDSLSNFDDRWKKHLESI